MTPTVAFHTLGCKLNFAETSAIARDLISKGYARVPFKDTAQVYVINTCSVTENADRECRSLVRGVRRRAPNAFIVITGCYAQLQPGEIAAIEGVDLVIGAREKFNLPSYLGKINDIPDTRIVQCDIDEVGSFSSAWSAGDRTRTFLKVQDGCDYTCTFCTIPLARGRSRSDTIGNVLANAREIASSGAKEVVLTGINLGDFGKGGEGAKRRSETFIDLIRELDRVDGILRFRISSIEPNLLSDEIIDFVAESKKFVPHFHIPLQSASDAVLGRMKRRYVSSLYRERVEKIKKAMPDACIGADVITGFPGESKEDFHYTMHFLKEIPVDYLHVFTYSERRNTPAIELDAPVDIRERKARTKMLRILSARKQDLFQRKHLGTERKVLFESKDKDGFISGYTDNYIRVRAEWEPEMVNRLCLVSLQEDKASGAITAIRKEKLNPLHVPTTY